MCQVSVYVQEGDREELLKDNITKLEVVAKGLRVSTLFEGATDLDNMMLQQIDFSAGKVVVQKCS